MENTIEVVYVPKFQTIGMVIDKGTDPNGSKWYRTDSDGIRESQELIWLRDRNTLDFFINKGAVIAPSTLENINNSKF